MKKKISELELYQVDYFVALAEFKHSKVAIINHPCGVVGWDHVEINGERYSPTTNPSQAWPIIERDKIQITYDWYHKEWYSFINEESIMQHGKKSLESAMRCFACSIYGEEIEI